jgi:hypothetical protein
VTVGRRVVSAVPGNSKGKDVEGTPLLDSDALLALIRLLQLAPVKFTLLLILYVPFLNNVVLRCCNFLI